MRRSFRGSWSESVRFCGEEPELLYYQLVAIYASLDIYAFVLLVSEIRKGAPALALPFFGMLSRLICFVTGEG